MPFLAVAQPVMQAFWQSEIAPICYKEGQATTFINTVVETTENLGRFFSSRRHFVEHTKNLALGFVAQVTKIATLIFDYAGHIIEGLGQVTVNLLSMLTATVAHTKSMLKNMAFSLFEQITQIAKLILSYPRRLIELLQQAAKKLLSTLVQVIPQIFAGVTILFWNMLESRFIQLLVTFPFTFTVKLFVLCYGGNPL